MTPAELVAAGAAIARGADLGSAELVALGWATVELDRAAEELAPGAAWRAASRDPLLGASVRIGPPLAREGPVLVALEPDTEGRIAASLARRGEGVAVAWVRLPAGLDPAAAVPGAVRWSTVAEGPLGPGRLRLGPAVGPHLVALVAPR